MPFYRVKLDITVAEFTRIQATPTQTEFLQIQLPRTSPASLAAGFELEWNNADSERPRRFTWFTSVRRRFEVTV
jgi:hypothetical protein